MSSSERDCEKSGFSLVFVLMLRRRASRARPESDSVDEVESVKERSSIGRDGVFSTDRGLVCLLA